MSERILKVSKVNKPSRRPWVATRPVASIRLTGRWLENLGFDIGEQVLVLKSPGKLELITKWKWEKDNASRELQDDLCAIAEELLAMDGMVDEDELELPIIGEA